jgi:hypothetical protein
VFTSKGSIAEREHLKWQNAQPMANNPYSSEALQRRLSESSSKSKPIEIHLGLDDNCQNQEHEVHEDTTNQTLQSVFSADLTDYKR